MKRILGPSASVLVAAAVVSLFVFGLAKQVDNHSLDNAVTRGQLPQAPDGSLPLLDARGTRTLAAYRGHVVVLNFWASWCGPCADEASLLEYTHRQLQRNGGGTVLGVAYEDNTPDSMAFERQHSITYPSLRDSAGTLAQKYGTKALPETFVLDPRGRVVAISRGQIARQAFLDQAIARAQRQ